MLNQPLKPMLLQPVKPAAIHRGWKSSLKWDGFRILIHYDNGKVRAFTRHGTEVTSRFPELLKIKLPLKTAILDGECIAFDLNQSNDQPPKVWWDDAMTRFNTKKHSAIIQVSQLLKAHFPLWDILMIDDVPLLRKSFMDRRELLSTVVLPTEELSVTPLYDDGALLFKKAQVLGIEGICQYNPNAHYYLNKRPRDVIVKIKDYQYVECQISSIRKGEFGWGLMLNGVYAGMLEFPPSAEYKQSFYRQSRPLIRGEDKDWIYLEPILSCRIKFQCFTKGGKLRSPKLEEPNDNVRE